MRAVVAAGIPVFAQFGLTPQTAAKHGIPYSAQNAPGAQATPEMTAKLVEEAKLLEDCGAAMLDFTNSGPVVGAAVVKAVSIPVIGGFGGGPWLDGRVRLAITAIGYGEKWLDVQDRHLRQHRQGRARRLHRADRRRPRRPADQGLSRAHAGQQVRPAARPSQGAKADELVLTYDEIEDILGFGLPRAAQRAEWWFDDTPEHPKLQRRRCATPATTRAG